MRNYAKLFLYILLCYTTVSQASAESLYIAIDVGQTSASKACYTDGIPGSITVTGCKEKATLFRVSGGYQFDPLWGAEISYGDYGKGKLGTATVPGLGVINLGDWQFIGFEIAGTATFPYSDAFSLTGKIGFAQTTIKFTRISMSATSTNLAYGIGAQYTLSHCIAIRAQFENLGVVGDNNTGTAKLVLLSAGIISRF